MIRMTTGSVIFDVDVDLTDADEASLTFTQWNKVVLKLHKNELEITPTSVSHRFTQQESALFSDRRDALVQLKARVGDMVYSHEPPVTMHVGKILDEDFFGGESDGDG